MIILSLVTFIKFNVKSKVIWILRRRVITKLTLTSLVIIIKGIGRHTNMVIIRLARGGAKKRPFFNMVVANSLDARDGRFIERVGFYNPRATGGEEALRVQLERVSYWQSEGAQLSSTVARLIKQFVSQKEVSANN